MSSLSGCLSDEDAPVKDGDGDPSEDCFPIPPQALKIRTFGHLSCSDYDSEHQALQRPGMSVSVRLDFAHVQLGA